GIIVGVWWIGTGLTSDGETNFDRTVQLTVVVFWTFFCLTGVALILLRERDHESPRPFKAPFYPILPIIFYGFCAYIVVCTILKDYQKGRVETLIGLCILLVGCPFYWLPLKLKQKKPQPDLEPVSK